MYHKHKYYVIYGLTIYSYVQCTVYTLHTSWKRKKELSICMTNLPFNTTLINYYPTWIQNIMVLAGAAKIIIAFLTTVTKASFFLFLFTSFFSTYRSSSILTKYCDRASESATKWVVEKLDQVCFVGVQLWWGVYRRIQ